MTPRSSRYEVGLLLSLVVFLVLSGIHPHDFFTWVLEVFPILIGAPILIWVYPRFRFTRLVYTLLWVHAIILMVGGHYTYAQVPLGFWMEHAFGFTRNHYDRALHFLYGLLVTPAAIDLVDARAPTTRFWRWMLAVTFVNSHSVLYELVEWAAALVFGGDLRMAYLGTQGDIWDAQQDMFLAAVGSVIAATWLCRRGRAGTGPMPHPGECA